MSQAFLPYSPDVETVPEDEAETIDAILASMHRLSERTRAQVGHSIRVSHAKSFGAAVGVLEVLDALPEELRQGLFAKPARYDVVARLANVPGEMVTDAVSTQRGFSFKVIGVEGEMLSGHAGEVTQDFVLDTGNRFAAADAKAFLLTHRGLEHAPQVPDVAKQAVSRVSRATNAVLHAVGGDSAKLDFFGHPRVHPLSEAYFTQAPIRYGRYVAKLAVVPVAAAQRALEGKALDTGDDPDALRTATVQYLQAQDAVFEVRVQLCTDLDTMPVEDASAEWPEEQSSYRTVAHLTLPRQDAYTEARRRYVDEDLSFCVSHSLLAHRPLGGIMRARMRAYPEMVRLRRGRNGAPQREPRAIGEVPG